MECTGAVDLAADLDAAQGLEPGDQAGLKMDDRLVVGQQPAIAQRAVHLAYRMHPPRHARADPRPVSDHPAAGDVLAVVQREIGILLDACRVAVSGRAGGDADRRGRPDQVAHVLYRLGQGTKQPTRGRLERFERGGMIDDHGEFVTADAEDAIGVSGRHEAMCGMAQQPVAGMMAERVVHRLEIVEVDLEQRPSALLAIQCLERGVEGGAVGKASQFVGVGAAKLLLHPPVSLERNGAQIDAGIDDAAFFCGRRTRIAVIERQGGDRIGLPGENRPGPAGAKAMRQDVIEIPGPGRVAGNIRADHFLPGEACRAA